VYGKLEFGLNSIFITDYAFHFEDAVRQSPQLLRHCISPRLPADPFRFIQFFSDETPL
jgi:hypothetical protein